MAQKRFQEIQQRIVYEDNHVIVFNKPSGVSIQPMQVQREQQNLQNPPNFSVYCDLKHYLQLKYSKPGNVFLGIVHRLDKLTSGICIFAKTSKSARRLCQSFLTHQINKKYLAIVCGKILFTEKYEDYINDTTNPVKIMSSSQYTKLKSNLISQNNNEILNYKFASSTMSPICQFTSLSSIPCTALSVELHTGRKHQIRTQLSSRGYPILGDTKYNAPRDYQNSLAGGTPGCIGLHSYEITFIHPTTKQTMKFQVPLPVEWNGKFINQETFKLITSSLK